MNVVFWAKCGKKLTPRFEGSLAFKNKIENVYIFDFLKNLFKGCKNWSVLFNNKIGQFTGGFLLPVLVLPCAYISHIIAKMALLWNTQKRHIGT